MACMCEGLSASVEDMESAVMAKDLSCQEEKRVNLLSPKVKAVYSMSRFEGKTTLEIAEELSIPKRTVEGYLLTGRKVVRKYMRQCI
ncbi:sigma factor-like helix-turn-helix DNA-binding protein [Phocaeicola plebeius]|uniref:sigma factor-like helix-turn-helix DNA-binding protein n=1 Tax=Phocaeicola plebeius TaxID=310297 RepID=UPI00241EBBDC|nr:sigma factor-like helix-turn-helix DNA-binding protein [Phocaeicola plebeius]